MNILYKINVRHFDKNEIVSVSEIKFESLSISDQHTFRISGFLTSVVTDANPGPYEYYVIIDIDNKNIQSLLSRKQREIYLPIISYRRQKKLDQIDELDVYEI